MVMSFMGTHLTVHWKPWMLCTILPSVLSLGTIMVHTTVLCTIRLAGQLYLWKEIIGRLLCTNLSLPPYLSSLISWHCNTVSTRSQSYLSSYLPHVKTELGKTTFCLRNLPFWTSSKDPWSCVLLFHWENVLTSCPFLHNSPVVTLIANCFCIQNVCCDIVFFLTLIYCRIYFMYWFLPGVLTLTVPSAPL